MDALELAQTSYTPQQMLQYGKKLLSDAHDEYLRLLEQGYSEDDAYWAAWDGAGADNFDDLAIIWAAGAIGVALESEAVREAIEDVVCFG